MADIGPEIHDAFRKMKEKDYGGAAARLAEGLKKAEQAGDPARQALFHSTLGVLNRLKGEMKEAWRHYEKAEKLLPDDPSLQIISAKFLVEQFAQYDTALKKLKGVLKQAKGSPSFEHQAHAIRAAAWLRKGERKKAVQSLEAAMAGDFLPMISAENINLDVIAAFLSRNFEPGLCRRYLEKGLELARQRGEERPLKLFTRLLESPPLNSLLTNHL